MKKSSWIYITVIVLVIVVVGVIIANKKSPKDAYSSSGTSSSVSQAQKSVVINNSIVNTKTTSSLGSYLVNTSGDALYTYDADSKGVSNCIMACLSAWPPYLFPGTTSPLPNNFAVLTRTDNQQLQYTYKGKPLYTFASDPPGKVTGNGLAGFSLARP